jgi:hypothetical protein
MNIWDIYQFCLLRLNKEQSGMSFTPEQFNNAAEMVNWTYFKLKMGLPEQYQPGNPFPAQAWQVSQKITDDMLPFIVWMGGPDYPLLSVDKYGRSEIPEDYVAFSSSYYDYIGPECNAKTRNRAIEFLVDAVFADRQQSPIKEPTKKYPVAKMAKNTIQFLPKDLGFVHFTYLRNPVKPELAYTYDSNADIIYNPELSVQFEWPQVTITDISNFIYEIMAGNIKSQLDLQIAAARKMSGQ